MGIINADELAKSYKLSLLKKIKAGDLHDDDLFQISSIRTNPKYFDTNAIDLDEFTKYIALKIGEHTGVEVTPYHDSGDKIATITVNNVPVDIYAIDIDTIAELTDVELTNLADGDILKYDSVAGKWKNRGEQALNTDYVAAPYDPNKAYAVGDYCMYNDKLYKCTTAISKVYWYKLPQTFNGSGGVSIAFSNTNADPEDTYVSITSNGTWVLASNSSGQVVHCSQFGLHDFSLTYSYQDVYYNSDYSNYNQSIVETYFENGGYETVNAALDDLIADRSFDPTKWAEVTVTDEISSALELPEVSAADNDKILKVVNGSWDKGSQDVLVIDCGSIKFGNASYRLNFPNGLTSDQIFMLIKNGTYIIFKVINNNIVYYSNICTSTSSSSNIYIRFTDFYNIYRLTHYEYVLAGNLINTYALYNNTIKDSYVPQSSSIDAGKVLTVNSSGYWTMDNIPSQLPSVSSSDEGKVLTVDSNGDWGAATPDAGGRVIFEAVWNMTANTYTLQNATTYDIRDAVLAGKDIALRVTTSPLLGSWIYNLTDAGYNNNVINHATFSRTDPGTVSDGTEYITSAELKADFTSDTDTLTYDASTVDKIKRDVYSISDEIDTGKRWYNGGKIFKKTYKARAVSMDGSTLNGVTVKLDDWNWKHTLINYECVGSQFFGLGRQQYGSYPISSNSYICSVFVQDQNGGGHASVTSPVELKAQIYGSTYASVIVTVYYVKTAFECSCEYSCMTEYTSGKVSIAGASLGARIVILGNNGVVILSGLPARFKKVRVMVGPDTYDCIGGQYPSSLAVLVGLYYNHPEAGWVEIEPSASHELDLSSKAAMAAGTLIDFTNSANADLLKQYDTCLAFQILTNYSGEELNPSFYPLTIDVEEWSEFDRS